MIRKSVSTASPMYLTHIDKKKCQCIANFVIVQCVIMFAASISIFYCVWTPDLATFDYYKLASIMYLYDKKACGYSFAATKSVKNLHLSNDTKGFKVIPIKCKPAIVTVSTRLSSKTRNYIKVSLGIHVIWMLTGIALRIFIKSRNSRFLKIILTCFFYMLILVILFDLSMAIVYVAHIKQSLTKGMIVRYSGWSVLLELKNVDDFAGWLPMIASACWMRGVIILAVNVYCCRIIRRIRNKIKKDEFRERYHRRGNLPIPEPRRESTLEDNVLYYRPGELQPYVKNERVGPGGMF